MPIEKLQIDHFMALAKNCLLLDVRSPGEYIHAHIPGARNLPLFTDEERKKIGTAYKQQNREAAIKIGLDYFGPRMRLMVEEVESLVSNARSASGPKQILIHCWRGGMRSEAVAWLLDLYGYTVCTLQGGYKSYRTRVMETFSFPFNFHILGGYTGSGKTYVLDELQKNGAAVINLEKLARHKGSAFGNIGMPGQPTQEMFENLLDHELRNLIENKPGNSAIEPPPIWIEDESQRIGQINIPHILWNTMQQSPVFFIAIPFEERLKHIVREYGNLDKEKLADSIQRIKKRLGPLETKISLENLESGDIETCFRILLKYYDKSYTKAMNSRAESNSLLTRMDCMGVDAILNAAAIKNNLFIHNNGTGNKTDTVLPWRRLWV